jgi:hypothetical protein
MAVIESIENVSHANRMHYHHMRATDPIDYTQRL